MDISSIAASAVLMKTSQTQQTISATLMKQEAGQQSRIASLLAASVTAAVQPVPDGRYGFSTYA